MSATQQPQPRTTVHFMPSNVRWMATAVREYERWRPGDTVMVPEFDDAVTLARFVNMNRHDVRASARGKSVVIGTWN